MQTSPLRRLRDCDGVAELERRALFDSDLRSLRGGWFDEGFQRVAKALFGLTTFELLGVDPDADEDQEPAVVPPEIVAIFDEGTQPDPMLVRLFASLGWDVTNEQDRPLYVLPVFAPLLLAAIRGVAGRLPPAGQSTENWGAAMEEEARRYRRSSGRAR